MKNIDNNRVPPFLPRKDTMKRVETDIILFKRPQARSRTFAPLNEFYDSCPTYVSIFLRSPTVNRRGVVSCLTFRGTATMSFNRTFSPLSTSVYLTR